MYAQTAPRTKTDAPRLEFVFEEMVELGNPMHPGATPWGERNIVPITGGTFAGPNMSGKVLPGGWDWQLVSKSGCMRLQADYMIQTNDGAIINVLNKGTMCNSAGRPGFAATMPVFEAPLGRYEWLNEGAYVGTLEVTSHNGKPAVRIRIFKAVKQD
jgi:hypothetical protein